MSSTPTPNDLRNLVKERAKYRCEYCLIPDTVGFFPHEIDHIVASKHGGLTVLDNLAYACWRCNRHKGSDLASPDPASGEIVFLFHPRQQNWREHFRLDGLYIVGLTPIGRATLTLLQLNRPDRLGERQRALQ